MRLHEVSSVQNRFLLADARQTGEHDWALVAREVCWGAHPAPSTPPFASPEPESRAARGGEEHTADRAKCDGLLVLLPGDTLQLRMFNPDGTEDFCGNGLICAAAYAWLTRTVHSTEFVILHRGHLVPVSVHLDEARPLAVTITLPEPSRAAADIPILLSDPIPDEVRLPEVPYPIRSVSTGTAHCVILTHQLPTDEEFVRYSRLLEHHSLFPERTSVEWVLPTGPGSVRIRIWERGVGETEGCGTGSAAVAAVTYGLLHQGNLSVESRGGVLSVHWPGAGAIRVTGEPEIIIR